jgi:membrane protease YdiL (CAAX protease family)
MDELNENPLAGQKAAAQTPAADVPKQPPLAPTFEARVRYVFLGPHGLRAGWRLVSYLLILVFLSWPINLVLHRVVPHLTNPLWKQFLSELGLFIVAVVPALLMARIEKRPFGAYGLPKQRGVARVFGVGAIWGLIGITALLLILRADGAFYFGGLALHGSRILKFAAYWGFFFLIVGLFEEFFFRGYTLYTAASGIRFWPAAILLSAGFGAVHLGNSGESVIGVVAAGAIGLFFCLTIRRTGNLWFAVGFHASWDWVESFLYSVPDSGEMVPGHLLKSSFHGSRWITGGSVGPEGSIFVFVVIALLWVICDRMYPLVKYQDIDAPGRS